MQKQKKERERKVGCGSRKEVQQCRDSLEVEERKLYFELQEKERQRQHQFKLKILEGKVKKTMDNNDGFRIASAVKIVPEVDDIDMEHYLLSCEKAIQIHTFPKNKWTALMHMQLT